MACLTNDVTGLFATCPPGSNAGNYHLTWFVAKRAQRRSPFYAGGKKLVAWSGKISLSPPRPASCSYQAILPIDSCGCLPTPTARCRPQSGSAAANHEMPTTFHPSVGLRDFQSVFGDFQSVFGDFQSVFGDFQSVFGDFQSVFGDFQSVFGDLWSLICEFWSVNCNLEGVNNGQLRLSVNRSAPLSRYARDMTRQRPTSSCPANLTSGASCLCQPTWGHAWADRGCLSASTMPVSCS